MTNVLKLIERQLATWEIKRRWADLGERPGRCLDGEVAYGPCLLISRECGSGGDQVARLAGERLGWHVFDREIVDEIAQMAGVRQQLLESVAEEVRANWENLIEPEVEPEDVGSEQYLSLLRQVVRTLGHHGDVVILGRGAQHLLPAACALRVRVVAPLEVRVGRVAQHEGLGLDKAQALVEKHDRDRAVFVQRCFQKEVAAPLDYDLTINTGEMTMEAAAEIVLLGLRVKLGVRPKAASRQPVVA